MSGRLRRPDFVDALLPTMVALIVYRAGLMIPIPGLEPNALPHLAHNEMPLGISVRHWESSDHRPESRRPWHLLVRGHAIVIAA